jgi:hypothetical protein
VGGDLVRAVARGLRHRPLGPDLPDGRRLAGPEPRCREGSFAKYGLLDLRFTAPGVVLAGPSSSQIRVCDDPTCLEMLREDLDEGRTWLLLLLEGGRPDGPPKLSVPPGYLPRPFRVVDACVTNAAGVWLWKHFYV